MRGAAAARSRRKCVELEVCDFETLLFGAFDAGTDYDHRNHFHFGGVWGETWSRHEAGRP
jgi:hypothetical protein